MLKRQWFEGIGKRHIGSGCYAKRVKTVGHACELIALTECMKTFAELRTFALPFGRRINLAQVLFAKGITYVIISQLGRQIDRPPTGTVTFLFTDIEGSTTAGAEYPDTWERRGHGTMRFCAMRSNPTMDLSSRSSVTPFALHSTGRRRGQCSASAQQASGGDLGEIPIRVRMGIHTGEAEFDGTDYRGYATLSLVQRLMSAGHGGQILVSGATENLLQESASRRVSLRDMGRASFQGCTPTVRIFQVIAPDLPRRISPLRTMTIFPTTSHPSSPASWAGKRKLADMENGSSQILICSRSSARAGQAKPAFPSRRQ